MNDEKYVLIYKRFIISYFVVTFVFTIKFIFFPDATIPNDINYLVRRYEEEISPNIPIGLVFMYLISGVLLYFSLYKMYKFENIYRYIFLFCSLIISTYSLTLEFDFSDSIDNFLEYIDYTLAAIIFTMSFLPPIKYKFEKNRK